MAETDKDPLKGDPIVGFNFSVDIPGITNAYFTEVEGLGSETEVIEHKVVGPTGAEIIRKVAGRLKWGDITLKRGVTANMEIYEWRKMVEQGKIAEARKDGSIVMYDSAFTEVARWNFLAGWPSKIDGPSAKADDNAVSVESLTIVHEGISRAT